MSWLVDLSTASQEAMLAARALLIDPEAPAGTRYVGGFRWMTPSGELVDRVAAVCPEALIEDRGAEPPITAGGGAYRRDEDGVWRYAAIGELVPGAADLTLGDLYPDLEIAGVGDQAVVLVPDALVRESDDLAWVREVASGPTNHYDRDGLRTGRPTPGWRDVWAVPRAEWDARAVEPHGILAPELQAEQMLDLHGVADRLGMAYQSVRDYHARGRLPAPQARAGGSPLWARPVIDQWHRQRPARGRPRQDS